MKNDSNVGGVAFAAVCVAALFSGAAALSYEIAWSRMLIIPLGNSNDATAIVLTAFMLGMAGGAKFLGSYSDRVKAPLKLYAILEIALGIYALPLPLIIRWLGTASFLSGGFERDPVTAILRYGILSILVAIPSLAMGATLPVLTRAVSGRREDPAGKVGVIYGVNTLGAAVGATIAGFFALPNLGSTATSSISVGLSILAGFIALGVNRQSAGNEFEGSTAGSTAPSSISSDHKRLALIAAAVAGFIMLGGEVLFARVLTFVFGHDTYAFAVLLSVVLLGLALGGFVHAKLAGRDKLVLAGVLIGLLSLALIEFFWVAAAVTINAGRDPFNLGALSGLAGSLELELLREIMFAPILVFVPAVLAGAAFPAACALYSDGEPNPGGRIGTVALVNGVGAALGALFVSFFLVGAIGIQGSFIALASIGAVSSVFIIYRGGYLSSPKFALTLAIPAVLTVAVAITMPGQLPKSMLLEAVGPNHQRIVHYEEGRTGTVSVTINEINGEKQLFMNAVNEVTTRLVHDQSFKLLGHLGPLLHSDPKRGLMICFGAGLSAGAAIVHPLKTLEVVELSAAIPGAANHWLKENNGVTSDPRFLLHIDDGRHFLAGQDERYDTILVDSTHPKAVDSFVLYTREFYELMRARLAEGGIAVQWVPLHGLSEREFKIIVRTFLSVFPETTLWVNVGFETYGQAAYVKMVGTLTPLLIDYKELAARLKEPRIRADLAPYGMDAPEEILDSFLAGPRMTARWTEGLPFQTDNHPIVPFTTKYSTGRRMVANLLLGVRSSVMPFLERMGKDEAKIRRKLSRAGDAQGFLLAGMLDRAMAVWPDGKKLGLFEGRSKGARAYYTALAKRYPEDATKLFEIGSYLGNLGHLDDAEALYKKALVLAPWDIRTRLNLAIIRIDKGETRRAVDMLKSITAEAPDNSLAHYNLGVAYLASSAPRVGLVSLKRALRLAPDQVSTKLSMAEAYIAVNQPDRAKGLLNEVVATSRWIPEAWNMLGLVAAKQGKYREAKKHHIQALQLEPYRAEAHYNLGIALQELGQIKEAAGAYKAALEIDPLDADAHNNLGLVYAAAGLYDLALASHLQALDVRPRYPEAAFNTGLVYKQLGQVLKAAEFFAMAMELEPTLIQAKEQLDALGIGDVEIKAGMQD